MSNISIGVTATELFAYNPFRLLGVAVNTPHDEITATYNKLMKMAESGAIEGYKTDFDFDSLPPFTRSAETLKTAYAKLASNGYRCFAYADSEFSASLNIDDIALNLRDITCYDCFLRCYMWLITNDRDLQELDLWIQLAKYIDGIITSSPDKWKGFFNDRFPADMIDPGESVYKLFHSTFKEIILLPLKEMVRGSMKCHSAIDILKCAGIDTDEEFDFIEIPQANIPAAGEPAPKLKLALKDGEEYFDIKTGKMVSYSTDTETAESNSFDSSASAPLTADVIINDEPEEEEPYEAEEAEVEAPYEEVEEPAADEPQVEIAQPEPVIAEPQKPQTTFVKPAPEPAPAPSPEPTPRRRTERKPAEASTAPAKADIPKPEPRRRRAVEPRTEVQPTAPQATQSQPTEAAQPAPRRSFRRSIEQPAQSAPVQPAKQPASTDGSTPFFSMKTGTAAPKHERRSAQGFTKLVEEAERKEEEAAAAAADMFDPDSEENEENMYTAALIEMLRANQSRNETMKSADTRRANAEKELAVAAPTTASMDSINMNKYDDKLLASPFEMAPRKLTREEKYRNVKIDDMLSTGGVGQGSVVEAYKKKKEAEKQSRRSLFALTGVLGICLIVFLALWYAGFI